MLPAVEPSPVEPITLLVAAVVDVDVEELLAEEPVAALSEKRLVEPRVAPRLLAGALVVVAAPEVSDEEDVLVAVLVAVTVWVFVGVAVEVMVEVLVPV